MIYTGTTCNPSEDKRHLNLMTAKLHKWVSQILNSEPLTPKNEGYTEVNKQIVLFED